jgi:transposase
MRFIQGLNFETTKLLQRIYKESKHHKVRQRSQCILLSYQGYMANELAHIFKVNRITIYSWLDDWESRHFSSLYAKKGRGRPSKLNPEQKEKVREWSKQYPKNLNKIVSLIEQEFGLEMSKSTIKRILKSFQLSWRRIRKQVKGKPDPEVYAKRKQDLEILIEEDRQGIIDLRYFDESGFCLIPYVPYAWQEKGETIRVDSGHSKRLNVLGFMNKSNDLEAYCFECSITSEVVIGCFDDFCGRLQLPTVALVDNASIHRSEAFQEKIPEWEGKGLSIFYLPEYSPELNLIEILWRFMKYEWIDFSAYNSWNDLVNYVEGVIRGFGGKYKIIFG